MRKSDYIIDAIYNLIIITACCAVSAVAADLVCRIVGGFIEAEFFVYAMIRSIILAVATTGMISAVKYKEGFKAGSFSFSNSIIGSSIGALAHVLIGFVLSFLPLVSGAPIYLNGIVRYGTMLDEELIYEGGIWLALVFAVVLDALYVFLGIYFKHFGAQNRKIEKYKLTGKL